MLSRRSAVLIFALGGALVSGAAQAAQTVPYTPAAFDQAMKAGTSILVEIQAPWCPTCKAQRPILSRIEKEKAYKHLLVVHVDFDSQKDALHRFNARVQSTLITFKGGQETGRSVGDTNPESIAALLAKAL